MLKFCPLFVLVALFGCQPGDMWYRELDTCGDKEYEVGIGLECENDILVHKCGDIVYDPETSNQFCAFEQLYDKCDGKGYDVEWMKCQNDTLLTKCGDDYYYYDYYNSVASTQFCYNKKLYDKCDGKQYTADASVYCSDGELVFDYKILTDSRDGKEYRTIKIGTQNWMAENLRYETSNTECFNYNPDNCEIHGLLYDWNTAKTVCPVGWHLPSNEEWDTLKQFVWGTNVAGLRLKANSELWGSGKGTDNYGFAALPSGFHSEERILSAAFFSATDITETRPGIVGYYYILSTDSRLLLSHYYIDSTWASVRCVED